MQGPGLLVLLLAAIAFIVVMTAGSGSIPSSFCF